MSYRVKQISTVVLASALVLSATFAQAAATKKDKAAPAATAATGQVVATVNGKPITKAKADAFAQELIQQGNQDSANLRKQVLSELISRELFAQEAERLGLTNNEQVKMVIEQSRAQVLVSALVQSYLAKNPVSDAEIQTEYDNYKKILGDKEYHVRHILVEKEDQAKTIIEKLGKGERFDELAKQSIDPGTVAKGGDLDWQVPATFVTEFSEAMVKLTKGSYTQAPVKSPFGWHVIQVDDTRATTPKALDEIKAEIVTELKKRKVAELQKSLGAKAKIVVNQ